MQRLFQVAWEDLTAEDVEAFVNDQTDEGLTWEAKGDPPAASRFRAEGRVRLRLPQRARHPGRQIRTTVCPSSLVVPEAMAKKPPNPKQHDIMVIIDGQSRSNGNTTLDGIRARYGNLHGWHVEPTREQVPSCLNTMMSADLLVRDGFGEGGAHYSLTHTGKVRVEQVKDARQAPATTTPLESWSDG